MRATVTVKVNRPTVARNYAGNKKTMSIPVSNKPYSVIFMTEKGKKDNNFLAMSKAFHGYGMTVNEWRQHGAEVRFVWFWIFGRVLKPIRKNK